MQCFSVLLAAALAAGCSTQTVRLYELREAGPGSPGRAAYERLERAVVLANAFLKDSEYAPVFPAARARFEIGFTDVMVHLEGEPILPLRVENTGLADLRTLGGHESHPTTGGFLSERITGPEATGDDARDARFFHLPPQDMAAILLRQAAMARELRARGEFDFWMNHSLLGLWPANGWGEDNPVTRRAYAVEEAFRRWLAEGGPHADARPGLPTGP